MNITRIFALAGVLLFSSAALAEGGGDRTFAKATQATDQVMEKYVANEVRNSTLVSSDSRVEADK